MSRLRYLWPKAIILILMLVVTSVCGRALTASQILDKSAAMLLRSKGITAVYTVITAGNRQSGSIKVKGKKFYISYGNVQTWYDGRTQWNYNASSNEVTLSVPTSQELAYISPFALVSSYKTLYTSKPLKSRIPGTYAIQLSPKSSQNPVKVAVIYIRSTDFQPCRLDVNARSGHSSSYIITSVKKGLNISDKSFVFPKSSFRNVQVIDLR